MARNGANRNRQGRAMTQAMPGLTVQAGDEQATANVEQTTATNPPFRPGVFTGSHSGQFAGTRPEQGAEKAQRR